ncbi:hypothetical protein OBBRIDRAFT_696283, partial [Obba rivulosa]
QKNLSGYQARWLEKISKFNFEVEYVPGVENVLANALSRIYTADSPGTMQAPTEYVTHNEDDAFATNLAVHTISMPVFMGIETM